ncbi:MAG: GTP cyclohydrolase I FolE [Deltaproteobacteria bacterium]|nr:GTP cyclohydrolase I FolE [Deltaproteobacteria bacterium]
MIPHGARSVGIPREGAFDRARFEAAVRELLSAAGFSGQEEHLGSTPTRVADLWARRLLGGYEVDAADALGRGFEDTRRDAVIIRGIAIHGVCPHHLVPFRGVAHVGYIPGGRLHGFGRVARMVDALSHRLTYQEWFTRDVVDALMRHGEASGAACVVEAEQLCLLLGEDRRGDERVITQAFAGSYAGEGPEAAARRKELLDALGRAP